ncbi:hypothetical protein EBR43_13990 [bacterium]|nr:hypothetical protein [bacterium]
MNDEQFRDILQHFIIAYDKISGPYPEHEYEGISFYSFVCDTLGIEDNSLKMMQDFPYVYDYKLNGIRDE